MSYASRFVGTIPALYERHLGPVLFEPYAQDLARRVPPGASRILEVAAGTGRVTRALLAVLPSTASILATDLNDAMIAIGGELTADDRVTWQQADAQALPVADGTFDMVVCQFGLMFVPDKPHVLAELRRTLRPGGTLLLSTWDALARNPMTELVHQLAMSAFPEDPPTFMLTPFSMPDPDALRELVRAAGLSEVRVETVSATGEATSAADVAIGLVRGNPLWNQLVERGVDGASFERMLAHEIAQRFGDRPCRSALSAHVVTAVA